jgi:hypothetical protein
MSQYLQAAKIIREDFSETDIGHFTTCCFSIDKQKRTYDTYPLLVSKVSPVKHFVAFCEKQKSDDDIVILTEADLQPPASAVNTKKRKAEVIEVTSGESASRISQQCKDTCRVGRTAADSCSFSKEFAVRIRLEAYVDTRHIEVDNVTKLQERVGILERDLRRWKRSATQCHDLVD